MSDAVDLARVHDIRSALKSIAEKLEVHKARPEESRIQLAVMEAKLESSVTSGESIAQIIKVREASDQFQKERATIQREQLVELLRTVQRQSSQWASEYRDFLRHLSTLYGNTRRKLLEIPAPAEIHARALAELEEILQRAVKAASQV